MSEIECPYCGYSYEYDDVVESDEWFEECEQCRKGGLVTRDDITVSNDDYKDAVAKQRGVGECSKHR